MDRIYFSKPVRFTDHMDFIEDSFNAHLSGNGPYTKKCENRLNEMYLGSSVLLMTSATHSLEAIAILLNIEPGDEVIVPSYTFVSSANAFALRGAKIKFVDCDLSGNMCLNSLEQNISNRTKAVVAVHYAGNSCNMEKLCDIIANSSAVLIEDAAQAILGKYNNKALGSYGLASCLSFHETKNISSGEGGALIMNDTSLLDRAEIIREKGTNRSKFFQGLADKYTWVDIGSSYILSDLNASYLYPQLLRINEIQNKRKQIYAYYDSELGPILNQVGIRGLEQPGHNTPNYHMYAFIFNETNMRAKFLSDMREDGIVATFHYIPLHSSPFGKRFWDDKPLLMTDYLSAGITRLPMYYNISEEQIGYIVERVKKWIKSNYL